MKRLVALVAALALASFALPASAQVVGPSVASISKSGSVSAINGKVVLKPLSGQNTCSVTISGTFVATVTLEALDAQGVAYAVSSYTMSGASVSTLSAPGYVQAPCGANGFQVRVSSYTSGTVAIAINATPADPNTRTIGGTVNAGTGFPTTSSAGTSASTLLTVQGSASGVAIPVSGSFTSTPQGWSTCAISVATAVVCKASAAHIVGVLNDSLSAQSVTVACYDNPSAASGTTVWNIGALGISQQITFPLAGKATTSGLTCIASAAPTGTIEVQYY